jgi:mRNA interferase RelE/StbE
MAGGKKRADKRRRAIIGHGTRPVAGPWTALAVPRYNKARKRLKSDALRTELNKVQTAILENPFVGDRKGGALRDVWVEKFQAENDQFLVAYSIDEQKREVTFLDIGQHENYYRDLEKYLRKSLR